MTKNFHKVFENQIPKEVYTVLLEGGEENGLIINLIANVNNGVEIVEAFKVVLDFGCVQAVRMIEEGLLLNQMFDDEEIDNQMDILKKEEFDNTIYEIIDGDFGNFIKSTSCGLSEYYGLKHYMIVTLNYVIEVVGYEPDIKIVDIK